MPRRHPHPKEGPTMTYWCSWCAQTTVANAGDLCAGCQKEPDAVEFKTWHDASNCPCGHRRRHPKEGPTMTYWCPWCAKTTVANAGDLCAGCQKEPDAVEFKTWHDASNCPCGHRRRHPKEGPTMTYWCPWCAKTTVANAGDLCAGCQKEPDAVEFKTWHDASNCPCGHSAATARCALIAGRDTGAGTR